MRKHLAIRLTESAVMLAFSILLSFIAVVKMPFGGDVTAFSMLPLIVIAYRYGWKWGTFTAFAYALLQMLLGINNVLYGTSALAVILIILFDYVLAFSVLGLGGVFRRVFPGQDARSQCAGMVCGVLLACALRYLCHVISGVTVWRDISIPGNEALVFSLVYNAAYMVPETILTGIGAVFLTRVLDFRHDIITRAPQLQQRSAAATAVFAAVLALVCGAVAFDAVYLFGVLNSNEAPGFDITRLAYANWPLVGGIAAGAALLAAGYAAVTRLLRRRGDAQA